MSVRFAIPGREVFASAELARIVLEALARHLAGDPSPGAHRLRSACVTALSEAGEEWTALDFSEPPLDDAPEALPRLHELCVALALELTEEVRSGPSGTHADARLQLERALLLHDLHAAGSAHGRAEGVLDAVADAERAVLASAPELGAGAGGLDAAEQRREAPLHRSAGIVDGASDSAPPPALPEPGFHRTAQRREASLVPSAGTEDGASDLDFSATIPEPGLETAVQGRGAAREPGAATTSMAGAPRSGNNATTPERIGPSPAQPGSRSLISGLRFALAHRDAHAALADEDAVLRLDRALAALGPAEAWVQEPRRIRKSLLEAQASAFLRLGNLAAAVDAFRQLEQLAGSSGEAELVRAQIDALITSA